MATSYPLGCPIPHCVYDALAYFLHAIGATPVIETYLENKKQRKREELEHARSPKSIGVDSCKSN